MDVLKKMFSKNARNQEASDAPKDEFRKPSWIDVSDTDDELFDGKSKFLFQIFTNPIELQKHFDNQMQQVLKSMKELEDSEDVFEPPTKDDYLKPGFDEHFMEQFRKSSISDTDLDGEIYADQLHSLLQRIQPDVKEKINKKEQKLVGLNSFIKPKMTDEQKIFGRIHGSIVDEENKPIIRKKEVLVPRMPPHFGGVFEGAYQGPKMFGQSIINQTIRKPDGTTETKQIIRDSSGNVKTTVTRTKDGKTETVTSYGKPGEAGMLKAPKVTDHDDGDTGTGFWMDKNIFVNKNGYALPMNLW